MGTVRHFYFDGKEFKGCEALTNYWNLGRATFMHTNASTVSHKINNWERENPHNKLTHEVYRQILTTRASLNSIKYKNHDYPGPKALFDQLKDIASITYTAFHLNLSNWRKDNPDIKPSDDQIESFVQSKRIIGKNGDRISPNKHFWQQLPEPKIGWEMMAIKIREFTAVNGVKPSKEEMKSLSNYTHEWLDTLGNELFEDSRGKSISISEFYGRYEDSKVEFSCFVQRVRKSFKRSKSILTIDEALKLIKAYTSVTRSFCILYQYTHKTTGMIYIGATTQELKERDRGHVRDSKKDNLNPLSLEAAIRKYGRESFDITILKKYDNVEDLAAAEIIAIAKKGSLTPNGYNIDLGGRGIGLKTVPIEHENKMYKNLTAIADAYHIPVNRLESRLRLGWSMVDAVTLPKGAFVNSSFSRLGDETLALLASKYKIPYKKAWERIVHQGWTLDETLEIESRVRPSGNSIEVTVGDIKFRSERQAALHFGIPEGTWRKRKTLGWTPEQRAGLVSR